MNNKQRIEKLEAKAAPEDDMRYLVQLPGSDEWVELPEYEWQVGDG